MFLIGELHIVFAFLNGIGKYIQDSGIDQTFVEAGLYGPAALSQILRGKHMKHGKEARMVMYLCLHKMYMKEFFDQTTRTGKENAIPYISSFIRISE